MVAKHDSAIHGSNKKRAGAKPKPVRRTSGNRAPGKTPGALAKPSQKPARPAIDVSLSMDGESETGKIPAAEPDYTVEHSSEDANMVVGIGASAGGLEALRLILPNLPVNGRFSYVIVQHLDPKHPSMLASLLARYTSMEVEELREKQKPLPDMIYITPPDKEATIQNGIIRISKTISDIGPKPSIDHFFVSLADGQGDKAIGIILSGTGSDGAHGMRAIKAAGGFTIAQDQSTAKYNGMPNAAIDTGQVDIVLPPETIGPELLSIARYKPSVQETVPGIKQSGSALMHRIFRQLMDHMGVNFSGYKMNTIQRRIARRMAVTKNLDLQDYVDFLEKSPQEVELLYRDILISVTSFFRDKEAFAAMQKVAQAIVKKKTGTGNFRVWIAGCATGEEAYSIAILFMEALGGNASGYNFQIFATDLDSDAIIRARRAIYPESIVAKLDKGIMKRYFVQKDNTFQVSKSLREMVVFATQDITKDPPFSKLDLVVCRNLLIYFNPPLQKRILSMFHYSLNVNGYLFLGKSESVGQQDDLFSSVNNRWKIFQRRESLRTNLLDFGEPRMPKYRAPLLKETQKTGDALIKDTMNAALAEIYGHPGVVIDDRLEIIFVHGNVSAFLHLPPGIAGLNIIDMAINELMLELRASIHKSVRENKCIRGRSIRMTINDKPASVCVNVAPIILQGAGQSARVVLFETKPSADLPKQQSKPNTDEEDVRIRELEQELAANREHLNTTVEELETANEELQSTNEELTTVNEEYQVKSEELAVLNNDLENIFKTSGISIILVDKALKIKNFSASAALLFNLTAGDIGQVITTIPAKLELPGLQKNLHEVIVSAREWSQEFPLDNTFYLFKIMPYFNEGENKSNGAIITFADITEARRAHDKLQQSEERYALAQRAANIGSWDWNIVTGKLHWSELIEPIFGFQKGQFGGTYEDFLECVHEDDRKMVIEHINTSVEKGAEYDIEHRIVWPDGAVRWMAETGQVIRDKDGRAVRMLGIVRDITDRKQNEQFAVNEMALLNVIGGEVCIIDADMNIFTANDTFTKEYGKSSGKCYQVIHGYDAPCSTKSAKCPFQIALSSGKPAFTQYIKSPGKDGEYAMDVSVSPIINTGGKIDRYIHISRRRGAGAE